MMYAWLALTFVAACTTKRNPDVCCTTNADCQRLGGIPPTGCPDGFVCRDLLCEESTCSSSTDCPIEQPVCNMMTASCTACATATDCGSYTDTPICDTDSGACRSCQLDAECTSDVCDVDTGRCTEEDEIIYASPTGIDTGLCTRDRPCSTTRAIAIASTGSDSIIRLLPGLYTAPITISSGTMTIIGSGAVLRLPFQVFSPLEVRGTANVQVHRLEIDTVNSTSLVLSGVRCEGAGVEYPTLLLRDSIIHVFIVAKHSTLIIQNTTLGFDLDAQDDATIRIDRCHFRQTRGIDGAIGARGARYDLRMTNSILENIGIGFSTASTIPNSTQLYLGFCTLVGDKPLQCPMSSSEDLAVFENSVFVSTLQGSDPVLLATGNNCAFINNLTFPQSIELGGSNINVDPMFVDLATRDLRLKPGSPAIDRATSIAGPDFDHDFMGSPRPNGANSDLGAFEFTP